MTTQGLDLALRIASLTKERDEAVSAAREASRMFEGAANAADKAEARIAELEAAHAEAVLVWQPRAEELRAENITLRAIADAAAAYVTALDRTRELGRMTQDERGERCREYDEAERVFRAALAARGKETT